MGDQAGSWLTTPRMVGIAIGGVVLVSGALYLASTMKVKKPAPKRGATKKEAGESVNHFKKYRDDLKDPDKRNQTLDLIYESTRYHETHDHFRNSGCLDVLLNLFAEHNEDEGVVFRLIRVLANLATNKENRLLIGESHAIEDMIFYLDSRWNSDIREDVLRGLMNLAIAPENEELIREKGALDVLLHLFKTEEPTSKILLHTSRVLVNLACNATNRKTMTKQKMVERTIELLHVSDDFDLLPRVVRLYGTFALECSDQTYRLLSDPKNATRLATLLKKQLELKEAKNASLCEIIIYAIARIVTVAEKKESLADEVRAFADVFGQEDKNLGCAPASLIASLVVPEGSYSAGTSQHESLYMAVVTALKFITSVSDKVKEALRNDTDAFNNVKGLQRHSNPHLSKVAKDLFDLVLPPITAVDELD